MAEKEQKSYQKMTKGDLKLVQFVVNQTDMWRDHRNANYTKAWEEYERLWRGLWTESDKTRMSERSQIVTPAIRQAIESRQAEMEEAIFGRNQWFDIEPSQDPKEQQEIALLKERLAEDFKKDKVKKGITQVNQLGEVYGTGIAEITIKEATETLPATQDLGIPGLMAVGTKENKRVSMQARPVSPKNFLIDPNATEIEEALGCAVEEFVGLHTIVKGMTDGIYRYCNLDVSASDPDLEPVQQINDYDKQRVKLIKYYGLVPREYLEDTEDTDSDKVEDALEDTKYGTSELDDQYEEDFGDMVEAIVVIADEGHLLKKEANPYMLQDRPIIVYRPDTIAGRFWGVGTVEKGYNMQKGLDAQIRMHLDASALATAPMMGLDATRVPRGFKFEIRPGKSVLTNGDPKEVLFPFNFGQVQPVSVQTAELFARYLQQATGTLDSSGLPQQVGNQADAGGMAIAMSGIIKRNKRSLINFQEDFLMPLIWKMAVRRMQFDPDRYPVKSFKFIPTSTLGIMAREYEQQQFIALMQTLGPQSPIVPLLLQGVVENSSLSSREKLMSALVKMSQPDPAQQQAAQAQQQLVMADMQATVEEKQAKAEKAKAEAAATPIEAKAKLVAALSNNLNEDNEQGDFEKRARIMELGLKAKDIAVKEKDSENNVTIAKLQQSAKVHDTIEKNRTARLKIERDADGRVAAISKGE